MHWEQFGSLTERLIDDTGRIVATVENSMTKGVFAFVHGKEALGYYNTEANARRAVERSLGIEIRVEK